MKPTLHQLKIFRTVAEQRSHTRAAAALHLTQPAVSIQVKQLEETVGLPLLEQMGKKIFLTEAGEAMLDCARVIADQLDEVAETIDHLKGIQGGRLRVSVATTAGHFVTRLLAAFSDRYPGVAINLDVTNRETLLNQLANNERDLVIMGQPPDDRELVTEPFLSNPLVMVAPPDHPLAGRKKIPLDALADACFVVREPGSGTRDAAERFFAEHDQVFAPGMEMTGNEAIKQAVEAGLGLAVVSLHTLEIELEVKRLVILDVQGFPLQRHWFLAQRRGKRLSPIASAFREFVLGEAGNYVSVPS